MHSKNSTPCVRCGKMRVISDSWNGYVGTSLVTYTLTVCPDKECQKIVDEEFAKKKDHLESIKKKAMQRKKENIRNRKTRKK